MKKKKKKENSSLLSFLSGSTFTLSVLKQERDGQGFPTSSAVQWCYSFIITIFSLSPLIYSSAFLAIKKRKRNQFSSTQSSLLHGRNSRCCYFCSTLLASITGKECFSDYVEGRSRSWTQTVWWIAWPMFFVLPTFFTTVN